MVLYGPVRPGTGLPRFSQTQEQVNLIPNIGFEGSLAEIDIDESYLGMYVCIYQNRFVCLLPIDL